MEFKIYTRNTVKPCYTVTLAFWTKINPHLDISVFAGLTDKPFNPLSRVSFSPDSFMRRYNEISYNLVGEPDLQRDTVKN